MFKTDVQQVIVQTKMKERLPIEKTTEYMFIDNVNLNKFSHTYNFRGVLICIQMDKLYLGMILHMNFHGVIICTIKDITFFEITKETDIKTFNTDYFNPPTFFSIDLFARTDVYYLNQISGKRPYGQELEQLCFSSEDKCYNASINGPDVLFQDKFFRRKNSFRNRVRVINKCNSIFQKKSI